MGWKCVETASYGDCPLPCAHGPALTLPTGRDVNHLARQVPFGSYPSSSRTCSCCMESRRQLPVPPGLQKAGKVTSMAFR